LLFFDIVPRHQTESLTVFDVYLNNRRLCRAGVGGDGVLDAIVSWVKLTGEAASTARRLKRPTEEARLHVGGLRENTHLAWSDRDLRSGDRVTIVLGRAQSHDPPAREKRSDPKRNERLERNYYLRLKRKFEADRARSTSRSRDAEDATSFLNVDLDIWSRTSLHPLVNAFGKRVIVLSVGKEGRRYGAHLELSAGTNNPDRLLRRFVKQVQQLPRSAKVLWNSARVREFNVGVQAGRQPHAFELRLEPETLRAVASVKAQIGFTVYGTD
jgi:hypothetical protein